eukprot:2003672-Pleurochrysis_carterae.AAC.4
MSTYACSQTTSWGAVSRWSSLEYALRPGRESDERASWSGAITKVGRAHARSGRETGEGGDEGVGLFDDHTIRVGTPTAEEENDASEHAAVTTLVVSMRPVARGL